VINNRAVVSGNIEGAIKFRRKFFVVWFLVENITKMLYSIHPDMLNFLSAVTYFSAVLFVTVILVHHWIFSKSVGCVILVDVIQMLMCFDNWDSISMRQEVWHLWQMGMQIAHRLWRSTHHFA
jgi:hypothetical protein